MADNFIHVLQDLFRETLTAAANSDEPIADESWSVVWEELAALEDRAQAIDSALNAAAWALALLDWREQLIHLATSVATFRGVESWNALEDLMARILKDRYPRIFTILSWVGMVSSVPDAGVPGEMRYSMDWEKVVFFLTDLLFKGIEAVQDYLRRIYVGDDETGAPPPSDEPDPGQAAAVLSALQLMAPSSLPMVVHGDLRVAPVPFPHVTGDPNDLWVQFRGKSSEWVNATLIRNPDGAGPPGDPLAKDRHLFGLVHDADPPKTVTIALRSNRYQTTSGDWVSDFEVWLFFRPEQAEFRLPDEGDSYLRIAPATLMGLGYDGNAGTWHSYIDPTSQHLPPRPDDPAVIEWVNESAQDQPDILIGSPHDSHLVIKELGAWIKLYQIEPFFEIGATAQEFSVVIMPSVLGLFKKYVRDGIRFDLDFEFGFVPGVGLTLNHAAGLEALAVLNWRWRGITLHSLRLTGEVKVIDVHIDTNTTVKRLRYRGVLRIHFSFELMKFIFVVDGAGVWYGLWGGAQPEVWGIEPFTGIGVGIQDENIQGGGFLYRKEALPPVKEEYGGLVHLKIRSFEVLAFGIYKEMEDGTTSFIMILAARFQPGITLPWGLELQGVGGLIAINRRADTDRLWQRLNIGTIGTILTADDPVKNAPIILGDLDYLFPVASGVHVFGPTVRLVWLKQVQLDLALIAEIATSSEAYGGTGLVKLILLGVAQLKRKVGDRKLLDITLNILGVLDFVQDFLALDAVLHKSKVLDIFKATGTAAARMSWGDRPYLMLTVGGFHPRFKPEPAVFPRLDRVGLTYDGKGSDRLKLRAEGYIALTANSYQIGCKLEAKIDAGRLNAEGVLACDALIRRAPFHFDVAISAKVRVRYKSRTLAGITLEGAISGPGPFTIYGKFCIEILFFDICWSDTFHLGRAVSQPVAIVASLLAALAPELEVPSNLASDGMDDRLVIVNTAIVENDLPVLPPVGGLVWSQRRAPLNCLLERFEGLPLAAAAAVVASTPSAAVTSIFEWFSPGTFSNLSDSEALNKPAFERLESGMRMGLDQQQSQPTGKNVGVHIFYLPETQPVTGQAAVSPPGLVVESLDGRTAPSSAFERTPPAVRVRKPGWAVRDLYGNAAHQGLSETDAHQRAKRWGGVALRDSDVITLNL